MYTAAALLRPVPPFDWSASLRFLDSFPATNGEQLIEDGELVKVLRAAGLTLVARLTSSGTVEEPELICRLDADEQVTERAVDEARDRLGFWLGIDDDLADFYDLAGKDEAFAPVAQRLYGYHQVKFPSPLESLCWAILVQRTPLRVAQSTKRRLVEEFDGNRTDVDGTQLWTFPDRDQLRSLDIQRLGDLVGNARKVSYLQAAIEAFAGVDERFLRTGPYDDVESFLLDISGIGPWSAAFVLIRGLGRTERIPFDKEVTTAAAPVYGQQLDETEFHQRAAPYDRWRGYWGHYLRVAASR